LNHLLSKIYKLCKLILNLLEGLGEDEVKIFISLKGDLARKFLRVKERLGLINNTDVIRFLICEKHRELEEANPPTVEV